MDARILDPRNMDEIKGIERSAFIPAIQTTEIAIRRRLNMGHVYLGINEGADLVGTLAFGFSHFFPNFRNFCKKNPSFEAYAERINDPYANAIFVYSLGIIPRHRNGVGARKLIKRVLEIATNSGMEFLVGDARIPSYNGSDNLPYEQFKKNDELHKAVDEYFRTGILPPRELIEQDPVAGFYLRIFPEGKVLGITDSKFWQGDEPCGGHMVIEYLKLK